MEIVTAPIPAESPFIPIDAKIVVGAVAPASPDPIPLVLLPGFEYRMRGGDTRTPARSTGGSSGESPPSRVKATSTSHPGLAVAGASGGGSGGSPAEASGDQAAEGEVGADGGDEDGAGTDPGGGEE